MGIWTICLDTCGGMYPSITRTLYLNGILGSLCYTCAHRSVGPGWDCVWVVRILLDNKHISHSCFRESLSTLYFLSSIIINRQRQKPPGSLLFFLPCYTWGLHLHSRCSSLGTMLWIKSVPIYLFLVLTCLPEVTQPLYEWYTCTIGSRIVLS